MTWSLVAVKIQPPRITTGCCALPIEVRARQLRAVVMTQGRRM
jgi:hypothetical protein